MMEIWKKVVGYEGIYEISSYGRLRVLLKYRKYRDYQSKILNPSNDKDGYLRTCLTKNKKRKSVFIHRLVAQSFIPNPENKHCVNHINGIKTDNRVENLEWVTHSENNKHAIKLGLSGQAPGELHHMSKLKKQDVIEIREIYSKKIKTQKELGVIYGVSQTQIGRIVNNKRWNKC